MRPFSFSISSASNGGMRLSISRMRLRTSTIATVVAGASVGVAGYHIAQQHISQRLKNGQRIIMPRMLAEAITGAAGEVAQIAVLYPLDTIKVRCQAAGCGAVQVVQELAAGGSVLQVTRQLYAGVLGAALCSVAVGALHWVSYCSSKRLAGQVAQGLNPEGDESGARAMVNGTASVVSALTTALVEAPAELFRHNAQAGIMGGNFVGEMVRQASRSGLGALYRGFLPYCFESWPYDITELLTYGQLKDLRQDALKGTVPYGFLLTSVPQAAWDVGIGAVAGTIAVLVSMPFDCVKTYMQTHTAEMTGKGIAGGCAAFMATGKQMVRKQGVRALYVGTVPRLMQQVPACMVCWWAIEACGRALEPYTHQPGEEGPGQQPQLQH